MDDPELLRQYVNEGSQEAFAQLMGRHVDMVYAAARRQVADAHLAEDVTQAVFMILAKKAKAGQLRRESTIAGWLLKAAWFAAHGALRHEARLKRRERAATAGQSEAREAEPLWSDVRGVLDQGMAGLKTAERSAVALRYLQSRSLADVAVTMGITEEAARKRVSRALEKLRVYFRRRGVKVESAALGTLMATHGIESAPATVKAGMAAEGAAGSASVAISKGALMLMGGMKIKLAVAAALVVMLLGGGAALWKMQGERSADLPPPPQMKVVRSEALADVRLKFDRRVFTGSRFPTWQVTDAGLPVQLGPAAKASVTYYDEDYRAVPEAANPGRYGAVLEFRSDDGQLVRRFDSLFAMPDQLGSWRAASNDLEQLPAMLAKDAAASIARMPSSWPELQTSFDPVADRDERAVIVAGGFYDEQMGRATPRGAGAGADYDSVQRAWWLGLKRKLYGLAERFPGPFDGPRRISGEAARALKIGSDIDAGFSAGTRDRIERLFKQASGKFPDVGVGVCIARHGVVFLHTAYGRLDEKPMTVQTPCTVKSQANMLSGIAIMLLVDRGLVGLDDPVARYLPPLRDTPLHKPVTIRDLFMHRSGLSARFFHLWGRPDWEEILSSRYFEASPGRMMYYSEAYLLGGSVIEAVVGKPLTVFASEQIFLPLGMTSTTLGNGWYARSTPMDLAIFAQMLLNRGAYGNIRIIDEKTFEKALPSGPERLSGIGLARLVGTDGIPADCCSERVLGFPASHAGTLMVDPDHDLVFVVTSQAQGPATKGLKSEYFPLIVRELVKSIADQQH